MEPRPALHRFQNSARAQNGQMKPKQVVVMCWIVGFSTQILLSPIVVSHAIMHEVSRRVDHIVS